MADLMSSALDDHLQRYGSSSSESNDETSGTSERLGESPDHKHAFVDEVASSSGELSVGHPVAECSLDRCASANNALVRWWMEEHPAAAQTLRQYASVLARIVAPFAPGTARRHGYRSVSHDFFHTLDRLDEDIPGRDRNWSARWRLRSRKGGCEGGGTVARAFSREGTVGDVGAGFATAAVVLAAGLWCIWRLSSPSWLFLLMEMTCASVWAANFVARADGQREAKVLESRLVHLQRSLGPFFRRVHSCVRMIRCSQTLSFGLRLSLPMPPVARMENRLSPGGDASEPARAKVALRELRIILVDILEGGVQQVKSSQRAAATFQDDELDRVLPTQEQVDRSDASLARQLLDGIAATEEELATDIRQFISAVAARVCDTVADSDVGGAWWESRLSGTSDAVQELADYFEAAARRLETSMGHGGSPLPLVHTPSPSLEIASIAEALSSLRLHYEETVVRLYSCQSDVSDMLRDPASSAADAWDVVHTGLTDARIAMEACDKEQWRKAEDLVGALSTMRPKSSSTLSCVASCTRHPPDESRQLEAGVGWVSLSTPTDDGPRVFEGGNPDEPADIAPDASSSAGVTDILVGIPSPYRTRGEGHDDHSPRAVAEDLLNERSRSRLVGELDSVLRARPLPPTCEKHLPHTDRQPSEGGEDDGDGDATGAHIAEQFLDLSPRPSALDVPVAENAGSLGLMSELRAQLSQAANEEIFGSDRDHLALSSDSEEDSLLVREEDFPFHHRSDEVNEPM